MYRWIEVPRCGEVYLDELRIVTNGVTPTVHDKRGTYYPQSWFRVEEEPEVDIWLFTEGPISAVAVKTAYRSAWNYDRWVKLFP
jgi:hypothetical protein